LGLQAVLLPAMQKESSEVFFSVTKLFQNKDVNLRRMVYLIIKDVCPGDDEVIIITSSLMKVWLSNVKVSAASTHFRVTETVVCGAIQHWVGFFP
jgi:coatomer subunit gamma